MLPINKQLIGINYSKGTIITPRFIVIHETDNESRGANAMANRNYFANHLEAQASTHYVVDDRGIVQCLEDNWRGWHVGDRYNAKVNNSNTIGIEICVNSDGDYMKARANAIELTKYLMAKHNISAENVVRHYDVTTKHCPRKMLDNPSLWQDFKAQILGQAASQVIIGSASINSTETVAGVYKVDKLPYNVNAKVINDWFYVRDENGNVVPGRRIDIGDVIIVLDISYSKQLVEVIYPTSSGWVHGYIKNVPSCIQYIYQGQYHNGSTSEMCFQESSLSNKIGSLDPKEAATPLFRQNGVLAVAYNTDKGINSKSGFVKYNGGFNKF